MNRAVNTRFSGTVHVDWKLAMNTGGTSMKKPTVYIHTYRGVWLLGWLYCHL